jgi:crooked neck
MHFKKNEPELKEERLLILENWLKLEQSSIGNPIDLEKVQAKLPKRVKKRRKTKVVNEETGQEVNEEAGWEEYYDYIFPDDQEQKKSLKILELAQKWKKGGISS